MAAADRMLASHYLQILHLHVACVVLSVSVFATRAVLRIVNSPVASHAVLRILSVVIDTTLLTAAILLTLIVHQYPLRDGWLTTKVLLLIVYIVLGTIALQRARTAPGRTMALLLALLVFGWIIGVAVAHDPAGWLLWL